MFCKNCGIELDPDALFCENCGTKVQGKEQLLRTEPIKPEYPQDEIQQSITQVAAVKTNKKLIFIILGAVLIVAIALIAIFIFHSNSELPNNLEWGMSYAQVTQRDKDALEPVALSDSTDKASLGGVKGAFYGIDKDIIPAIYDFSRSDELKKVTVLFSEIGAEEMDAIIVHLDKKYDESESRTTYTWKAKNTQVEILVLDNTCILIYTPLN